MTTELERERTARIDAELRAAAQAAGLQDVDLIGLPTFPRAMVKFENGAIVGIPEAIASFKAAKPAYFTPAAAPPAPRQPGGNPTPPPPANPNPPPADVRAIPKTPEGRREYDAAKRQMISTLRHQ